MLHARKDYQRIQDPWAGEEGEFGLRAIPRDEPVLLIRGQDKLGWMVCAIYAILHFITTGNRTVAMMALYHSVRMLVWAKKDADVPLSVGDEALREMLEDVPLAESVASAIEHDPDAPIEGVYRGATLRYREGQSGK